MEKFNLMNVIHEFFQDYSVTEIGNFGARHERNITAILLDTRPEIDYRAFIEDLAQEIIDYAEQK